MHKLCLFIYLFFFTVAAVPKLGKELAQHTVHGAGIQLAEATVDYPGHFPDI